jgi:hypothetical protein
MFVSNFAFGFSQMIAVNTESPEVQPWQFFQPTSIDCSIYIG